MEKPEPGDAAASAVAVVLMYGPHRIARAYDRADVDRVVADVWDQPVRQFSSFMTLPVKQYRS
jgi:hypothetical protein